MAKKLPPDARKVQKFRSPKSAAGRSGAASKSPALRRGAHPDRVKAILAKLDEAYPDATCALNHKNAFELLIATILSAQCTDVRVNEVTKTLFPKYPNPEAFAYANPSELEADIRPTGFFRNKTKSIMGASKKIIEDFKGQVPRTMEELLTLPGVARKTANVVLGVAFGIASGVVVDTHVQRLSGRLDLTKNTDPKENRAGLDAGDSERKVDSFFASIDLAWAADLPGPEAQVHRMQSRAALLLQR